MRPRNHLDAVEMIAYASLQEASVLLTTLTQLAEIYSDQSTADMYAEMHRNVSSAVMTFRAASLYRRKDEYEKGIAHENDNPASSPLVHSDDDAGPDWVREHR